MGRESHDHRLLDTRPPQDVGKHQDKEDGEFVCGDCGLCQNERGELVIEDESDGVTVSSGRFWRKRFFYKFMDQSEALLEVDQILKYMDLISYGVGSGGGGKERQVMTKIFRKNHLESRSKIRESVGNVIKDDTETIK